MFLHQVKKLKSVKINVEYDHGEKDFGEEDFEIITPDTFIGLSISGAK